MAKKLTPNPENASFSDSSTEGARTQAAPVVPPPASSFTCSVKDNPTLIIQADGPQKALAIYLDQCGIISTENPVSVVALT